MCIDQYCDGLCADRVEYEVRRIGVPGANLRSSSSRPLRCKYKTGTSCVYQAKSLSWNRGVPMASRRGQNSARGFLFVTSFAPCGLPLFQLRYHFNSGTLSCTFSIAISREVTWNTAYFGVFWSIYVELGAVFNNKIQFIFSAALWNFIFHSTSLSSFFRHIFTFRS